MLVNMEERARHRHTLRTEREAKRRAIEEEKFARVQRKPSNNTSFNLHWLSVSRNDG